MYTTKKIFVICLVILLSLPPAIIAQELNLRYLSTSLISGNYTDVDVCNETAYIATGYGFKIVDVSNPANPLEIAHIPTNGNTESLTASGDFLFTCDALGGTSVYDISNPAEPIFLDMINTPGHAKAVLDYEDYLYIATESYGVQIVDYSDPYNLELVNILYTGGEASNLAICDHWLYVTLSLAGLGVYDLSEPEEPEFMLNWNTLGGNAKSLYIFEAEQYLAMADFSNGLHILDLTFPWIPTWSSTISNDSLYVGTVSGADDYGVFTYFNSGIRSFDAGGQILDAMNIPRSYNIDVSDNYAYVAKQSKGYDIIGCYPPSNLNLTASVPDSGEVTMVISDNGILYIPHKSAGLSIVDATDPWNPELINRIPTDTLAMSITFTPDSQYFYLADYNEGILVFDLVDPLYPELVNTVSVSPDTGVGGFNIWGDYLYVSFWNNKLHVYDISEPENPILINNMQMPSQFRGVVIAENGNRLYAVCGEEGLSIYTIYEPDSIVFEYTLGIFNFVGDLRILENFGYVAAHEDGLFVIDVTNYAYIFKVDSIPCQSSTRQVTIINDDYLVYCDWDEGFGIVDISDPSEIAEVVHEQTPSTAWSTGYDGSVLYVCEQFDLLLYDLFDNVGVRQAPKNLGPYTHTLFHPAYPNPFNASTRIGFELNQPERVKLSLYNIRGEEVCVLTDSYLGPGIYWHKIESDNLSSGVYFACLHSGFDTKTQKITLIK